MSCGIFSKGCATGGRLVKRQNPVDFIIGKEFVVNSHEFNPHLVPTHTGRHQVQDLPLKLARPRLLFRRPALGNLRRHHPLHLVKCLIQHGVGLRDRQKALDLSLLGQFLRAGESSSEHKTQNENSDRLHAPSLPELCGTFSNMSNWTRILSCAVLAAAALSGQILSPAWVELGEGGRPIARIIVNGRGDCPSIQVDGRSMTMLLREPVPDGLRPACEFVVPQGAKSASVNRQILVLPSSNVARAVVLGDTGCRIKGDRVQDCNDPAKWPFQQVATRAASEKPAVVVHVGDYLYRENVCPPGSEAKCRDTPAGDNWETWNADFFAPAAKLLAAAPWAFSRGNHEDCQRSWQGWFYYLDPRPFTGTCQPYSRPYLITIGKFELAMLDSSAVHEDLAEVEQVDEYAAQLRTIHATNAWLVAHHPFWGFKSDPSGGPPNPISAPLAAAWDKSPPHGISLVVSGHIHLFELLNFDHGRPSQLVAGDGGTDLAMAIETSVKGSLMHGASVVTSGSQHDYGYTLFSKTGARWQLTLKSRSGAVLFRSAVSK
jgi:hypothetical protein